jgi:hypothetical protein
MEVVQNEVVSGKTIVLDEKLFVRCKYSDCKLLYGGGEVQWQESTFEQCQIVLSGAAQRTANLLVQLGAMPPGQTPIPPSGKFGFPKAN